MTSPVLPQSGIKPKLSLLIISDHLDCKTAPSGVALERVVVTPEAGLSVSLTSGERRLRSDALPSRRLNLAVSLASGEWVVPITGDVELGVDWLSLLENQLSANNEVCVLILRDDAGGGVLFAIRRRAFAYGALDERIGDAHEALFDWAEHIFPLPKYRTIGYDGIKVLTMSGLRLLTNRSVTVPACVANEMPKLVISTPSIAGYEPGHFWEQGTADYVKWEVFQPDEPEIEEVLKLTQPRRVLELGCGAGRNIRYFSACERYVGIDISSNLLHRAGSRVEANVLGLVRGDVVRLPFASAMFDLVFSTSTVQHVVPERIEECIVDMLRVSSRYVCLIEFVDELPEQPGWFQNIHMFKHDYASLMQGRARLLRRGKTGLQIQPAVKEYFLFEKI